MGKPHIVQRRLCRQCHMTRLHAPANDPLFSQRNVLSTGPRRTCGRIHDWWLGGLQRVCIVFIVGGAVLRYSVVLLYHCWRQLVIGRRLSSMWWPGSLGR